MKKIIGIFIVTLLIATALPVVGNMKESKNEESETESYALFDDDCECNSDYPDDYFYPGGRPESYDFEYVSPEITIKDDFPEYFSWKDYEGEDWTTPAKDQMYPMWCGSCFIYAALGALESVIKIKEECSGLNIDLSEQYVLSCLTNYFCYLGGYGWTVFK